MVYEQMGHKGGPFAKKPWCTSKWDIRGDPLLINHMYEQMGHKIQYRQSELVSHIPKLHSCQACQIPTNAQPASCQWLGLLTCPMDSSMIKTGQKVGSDSTSRRMRVLWRCSLVVFFFFFFLLCTSCPAVAWSSEASLSRRIPSWWSGPEPRASEDGEEKKKSSVNIFITYAI